MFKPNCLLPGRELAAPQADLKGARRVGQYRLGAEAVYIPAGLRWDYLPLREILRAEESHRSITAGKCVAVTEKRPVLLLHTADGDFSLPLERAEQLRELCAAIGDAAARRAGQDAQK